MTTETRERRMPPSALPASLFLCFFSQTALAVDCEGSRPATGPCIECEVSWPTVRESLAAPALYWDVCRRRDHPVVHYFPKQIAARIKEGRLMTNLRRLTDGRLVLDASLGFVPTVASDQDERLAPLLASMRARHPGVTFLSPVPESVTSTLLGNMASWTESIRFDAPSLLNVGAVMKLRVIFKSQFETQVRQALRRPAGLVMRVSLKYQGYTQAGSEIPFDYVLPLSLGDLEPSP